MEEDELPPPPNPPDPDECCGNGCQRCVYDIYEEQLQRFNILKAKIEQSRKEKSAKNQLSLSNGTIPATTINNLSIKESDKEEYEEEEEEEENKYPISIEYLEINDNNNDSNTYNTSSISQFTIKLGKLVNYKQLTSDSSPTIAYHMEIDTLDENVKYEPGDYISLLCPIEKPSVDRLLKLLNLNGNQYISIKQPINNQNNQQQQNQNNQESINLKHLPNEKCLLRDLFTWRLHITFIPPQFFLKQLSEYCTDKNDKDKLILLSSTNGTKLYQETIVQHHINFTSLLAKFKSCKPPLAFLIVNIPPNEMRQYSIANSPLSPEKTHIHIAFNLLIKNNNNNNNSNNSGKKTDPVYGQCTYWMYQQIQKYKQNPTTDIIIPFMIQPTLHFKLPSQPLKQPILLVSTGVGLSPFRSFLQHRKHLYQEEKSKDPSFEIGKCLLFFGCRRQDWDLLYHDELLQLEKERILTKLYITFSQEETSSNTTTPHKKYINSLIEENGDLIYKLIEHDGGTIYVCGNSLKIGKSSKESLLTIIGRCNKSSSIDDSKVILNKWIQHNQLLMDVWV